MNLDLIRLTLGGIHGCANSLGAPENIVDIRKEDIAVLDAVYTQLLHLSDRAANVARSQLVPKLASVTPRATLTAQLETAAQAATQLVKALRAAAPLPCDYAANGLRWSEAFGEREHQAIRAECILQELQELVAAMATQTRPE